MVILVCLKGVANRSFSNTSFREMFQNLATLICIVGYYLVSRVNRQIMVFKIYFHIASENYMLVTPDIVYFVFNPFQSNFSANRILPSSYLFWAVKRMVDYL
jgi:hypothetical protein